MIHRIITGDCLDVLRDWPTGDTFDLAYCDPPYGTGRADLGYDDGTVGGEWVDFLRPRLVAVRSVLKPTGVLLFAVDDEHHAHASLLLDEVFGRRCRLGTLVLAGASNPSSRFIATLHEYVLAYARSFDRLAADKVTWREPRPGAAEILEAGTRAVSAHPGDDAAAERSLKDWWRALPRGHASNHRGLTDYRQIRHGEVVRFGSLAKPRPHPAFEYDIVHPVTGRACPRSSSGAWRWTQERMVREIAEGNVEFGPDESTPPRSVIRLRDVASSPPPSVITVRRGAGAKRLTELVSGATFAYPKDPFVLARMFGWSLPADGRALDPFAGSGSSLDAITILNQHDKGSRSVVLAERDPETVKQVVVPRAAALGVDVAVD